MGQSRWVRWRWVSGRCRTIYIYIYIYTAVAGLTMFNALPDDLRDPAVSITTFGQSMKTHLFSAYQHVLRIRVLHVMRYINVRYLVTLLLY